MIPEAGSETPVSSSLGFDRNPTLQPGKEWSVYAQIGYRFRRNWQLIGFMYSVRFGESN